MRMVRVFALCAVVCLSLSAMAQTKTKSSGNAVRGKYLATQTGLCQDCHSPRDEKGQYIQEKWLHGAPIMFTPSIEIPWAGTAPPIAGLEGWTDQQAIKFLTTGIDKDGKHLQATDARISVQSSGCDRRSGLLAVTETTICW